VERFWETLVGAAVTVAVAPLIFPPNPLHEVASTLERIAANLVADLRASAALVGQGSVEEAAANLERVTGHTREALTAPDDVARARRALRYNPIRAGDRSRSSCCRPRWRWRRSSRSSHSGWPRTWRHMPTARISPPTGVQPEPPFPS
jgi:hypothetical protein